MKRANTKEVDEMTKRIIGYLRVSTDGQAETGYGLDVQRERVGAYARSQGFVVDEFIVDDGYSGTTLDRPGLQRLLGMCAKGEVAKVIVYSIDRLARKQRLLLELIEDRFDAHGVAFVSVSQQFDTSTPFGRAMLGMLGVFAQLDRDQIVDRLANGRKQRAAKGERASGAVPYGYESVKTESGRVTRINEAEATWVRYIIAQRDAGQSLQRIADDLNAKSVPSPRGGRWAATTIADLVKRPIYRGTVAYRCDGSAPIIVSNENLALV